VEIVLYIVVVVEEDTMEVEEVCMIMVAEAARATPSPLTPSLPMTKAFNRATACCTSH